jgi:hypothetical protein
MKQQEKISFWRLMRQSIKDTRQRYKELKREAKDKAALLSSKSNWSLIETYIQQCNKNPDLKVTINLTDGTIITMTAYKPEAPSINALLNDITIE